jgi:hypothetical protein
MLPDGETLMPRWKKLTAGSMPALFHSSNSEDLSWIGGGDTAEHAIAVIGYRYETTDPQVGHYQWICPRCRRALLALAQGRLWEPIGSKIESVILPTAMPLPVNPGLGEGPWI